MLYQNVSRLLHVQSGKQQIESYLEIITKEEFIAKAGHIMTQYAEYEGILINPSSGGVVEHDRKDEDENILRRAFSSTG